jgi:very-short-patch-repair endonuclease
MTENQPDGEADERARSLRKTQTVSERLLWSVLRARQLCGLQFRRQHLIEPWIVDFACPQQMLVVEIDGGYDDNAIWIGSNGTLTIRAVPVGLNSTETTQDATGLATQGCALGL